jgi:hypothetical protein
MKLFKAVLLLLTLLLPGAANALQLDCGEYEVVGEYGGSGSRLLVGPGTNGQLPLTLVGSKVLSAFLPGRNFYRVKIAVLHKIGDEGGAVKLLSVDGLVLPTKHQLPFRKTSDATCE